MSDQSKTKRAMTILLSYLLMLLAVFLLQRKLLYVPDRFTAEQQKAVMANLNLRPWPSENDLRGFVSRITTDHAKGTVLVFHGNAGSALNRNYFIAGIQRQGYRVILAEYPGYTTRAGTPSETTLIKDAITTAEEVLHVFGGPLILCGESLGSGVVAGIVASKLIPVKGLLLITPFDSMVNVAQHHYWIFLARWLLLDRYDNVSRLRTYDGPVAIISAEQDAVIPNSNTIALFDQLPGPKKRWHFKNAGHNTLPMDEEQPWWGEVMQFIDASP